MSKSSEPFDGLAVATIFILESSMIGFFVAGEYNSVVFALMCFIIYNVFWSLSLYLLRKLDNNEGKILFMVATLMGCLMWIDGSFILSQLLHINVWWIIGLLILFILISVALVR